MNSKNQANQIAEAKRQRITEYDGKEAQRRDTSAMVAKYAHLIGEENLKDVERIINAKKNV